MARCRSLSLRVGGFTLIEAMVTLAVLVILLTVAAPSFREYTQAQQIKNASSELASGLTFARSEAIARRADVAVTAVSSDFAKGWTVAAGGVVLREQAALSGVAITASATSVTYGMDGRAGTQFTAFIKAPGSGGSTEKRCLSIDPTGMPRSRKTTATTC